MQAQTQNLTIEEINSLIAALKVWENEPTSRSLQSSMIGVMLSGLGKQGEEREKAGDLAQARAMKEMEKAERDATMHREESVLLQAKLIQMQQASYREQLT